MKALTLIVLLFCSMLGANAQSATPTTVWYSYQTPLHKGVAANNLFVTQGPDSLDVYGFKLAHPTFEWDHMYWGSKTFGGSGGLFLTTKAECPVDPGIIQYFGGRLPGNGKLAGYFLLDFPQGTKGYLLQMPNNRFLWHTGVQGLSLGVGNNFSAAKGKPTCCLVGPLVEYQKKTLGVPTKTYRVRFGKWVAGPTEGQYQVRFDLIVKL